MSRSARTIQASLIAKLPPGWALGRRGGILDTLLYGVAVAIAVVEAEAEAMMDELDPRTSVTLLPDFERCLGPDPCGRDEGELSLDQRQRLAHQRWTATGGQSLPYLIETAARLGEIIEIEEFWPSDIGVLEAGGDLIADGEQFVWLVKLADRGEETFNTGAGQAGDPLGWVHLSDIECELRRIAHAHTTPVFSYVLEEAA